MAFYKSKYTGTEIDQRLTQGTYDDAVKAGFTGSKEEFDKIIVAFDENAQQKLDAAQPKIDHRLETLNKSIVDAINELHDEVNQKQDIGDCVDKEEFEVFKDEVATTYATKEQVSEEINRAKEAEEKLSDSITTVNSNLVNSINTLNKNVSDSLKVVNEAIQQSAETLVAEIEQRKEADSNLQTSISQETTAREALAERVSTLENADYQTRDDVTAKINEVIDNAPEELNTLKKIADSLNNDPDFATTMTTELSKKLDSDKLLAGAGIDVREEGGKKIVDISEETLTKIQYADSEVRRLEKDKISYAYDEKTQSNINVILPEGGSYLGNYGNENATIAKAAVYDEVKQLELGSSKVHTNINTDSDVTIETSTGKKTIATTDELVNVVNIPIRSLQDKIYTQEEIFNWFGVTSVPELKQKIVRGSQMYLRYGISLSGNPMYYKMPIEYTAFESANQIKLVLVGLNTRDDVASKYEIIMNLDGTIIEGNSNVKMTISSIESGDIDLSEYVTKKELNDYALKSELPDTSGFATTEALDTKADKTELENVVKYTDISDASDTPRRTIMLDNNDTLSAYNTIGTANNIAMISKWDVVDLGSTGLPINLNGSKERPTYNDDTELALVSDIPDISKYATTTELASLRSELQQTETGVATANSEIEKLQSGKQSIQDESLQTISKTIVSAINELLTKVQQLETKNTELESRLATLEEPR